jgi:leucyl aminopeptidase (aminopeptidase T)
MTSRFKPTLLAGLLALSGVAALAQMPMSGGHAGMMAGHGDAMHEGMRSMDPARMQARMDKQAAELKAQLKLIPAQEAAWTTFVASHKMPADMMAKRPDRAAWEKLTTPERLDRMKALRSQHMTAMDRRDEATRVFYATLMPDQQKVFDASATPKQGRARHMDHAEQPKAKP